MAEHIERHEIQDAVRTILGRADDLLGRLAKLRQNHANERARWEQYARRCSTHSFVIGVVAGSLPPTEYP